MRIISSHIAVCAALIAGQMITMQDRPVVHLRPNSNSISADFGGDLVELINAPPTVFLPGSPPATDAEGNPWSVDVKNMGTGRVMILAKGEFTVAVAVGQTVHIHWDGTMYSLAR
jgi:hypothetical protein